ncbi:MAG: PAS domain S-box protein [Snowella sp.]|nr:PAS domain S-box protein [Snowella sp.]
MTSMTSKPIFSNEEPRKNDWDKSQAELIAELNQLRTTVSSLNEQLLASEIPFQPRSPTKTNEPYRLLVVDDSPTDRAIYRRYLNKNPHFEYEIVDFATGSEALQWCQTYHPDLLLIDYFLPDMNGLEFLERLRQQTGYQSMPGIIITGQQNPSVSEQSLKDGAKDVLDKNRMTSDGLNRAINNVLQHAAWMQEQEWQWRRQQVLNHLAASIRQGWDLSSLFQSSITEIRQFLDCDRVLIYQFDPQNWCGTVIQESVLDPTFSIVGRKLEDNCFAENPQWINRYRQGHISCIADTLAEPHNSDCYQNLLESLGVRAVFAAPLLCGEDLWGLLIAHHCQNSRSWELKEVELLHQVANQLSIAIQQTHLQQQAEENGQERQKITEIINTIATVLVSKIGDDFFQLLVNYLCQILDVDYVLISELMTESKAKTLAICHQQQIINNVEMDLRDRPCGQIVKSPRNAVTVYQDRVNELFPNDHFIQAQQIRSYLGIPLFNSAHEPIGILAVFHRQPLPETQLAEEIFKIFAGRAGAELERRQIEAKLRRSEQDLLEAQQIAHVGHWKWDKATDQMYWSEELYRIFGIAEDTPITLDLVVQYTYPDDRAGLLHEIEQSYLTHHYNKLHRICCTDGSIRFLQTTGSVTFGADGQINGLKGISLDVTELKQAELKLHHLNLVLEERVKERTAELTRVYLRLQEELEERKQAQIEKEKTERMYSQYLEQELAKRKQIEQVLQEREAQLRVIGDNLPKGALYQVVRELDGSFRFLYFSAGIEKETGYKVEEIYQDYNLIFNTILEEDRPLLQRKYQESLANLSIFETSIRMRSPSGEIRWIRLSASPRRLEDGRTLWDGIRLDVTELKETQEKLYRNQLFLTEAQRVARIGSWEVNLLTQTQFWSDELFAVLNLDPVQDYPTLDNYLEVFHPDDRDSFKQAIDEVMLNGTPYKRRLRIPLPNGNLRYVESIGQGEKNPQGQVSRIYGTVQDVTEQQQAAELLQFQAQILTEIHDAVISTDANGRVQTWNHGAEKLFGYTAEESIGQPIQFLYLPEDLSKLQTEVFEALQTKERHQVELRSQTKAGEEIYIRLRLSTIRDDQGNIINIIGCSNDITARKRYEAALVESKQFLQTVLDSFPLFVFWKDRNLKYLGCNQNFANICGLSSVTEIYGKSDEDLPWSKEESANNQADDRRVIETGESHIGLIERHIQRDGTSVWLETNKIPLRDVSGEIIGVLETYRDITSRKQAEAAIQEFNRRWRSVLDSIQMIVVEVDAQGRVEYINPFFQKLSEYTPAEVLGKHWVSNFIPPSLATDIDNVFHRHLRENSYEYHVNPILTKSGEERIIAWRNSVLRNPSGDPIGMVAIGEDVTDRYHLERMKAQFLSIVSHELRTPLTAIQAALSLLHDKVLDPNSEEGEITLTIATDGIERLVRLVNDILDLERLQSGKLRLEKHACNTQKIIKNAIAQVQNLTQQTGTEIRALSQSINLYADEDRLIQVLINLLSNAIKFSPNHSEIILAVDQLEPPLGESSPTDWVKFTVSDRGRGIPPQNLESIFEPFQQVDASDAREKGGTGLGLAICRDIVEQHGGKIWVKSEFGKGSTFFFTIPTESFEAFLHEH